jgi:hypothetical protein
MAIPTLGKEESFISEELNNVTLINGFLLLGIQMPSTTSNNLNLSVN